MIQQYIPYHQNVYHLPPVPFIMRSISNTNTNIALNQIGTPYLNTFYYKYNDDLEWTKYNINDVLTLSANLYISFSGTTNQFSKNTTNYYRFSVTDGNINLEGDLNALINNKSVTSYGFIYLFSGCNNVVDISLLNFPSNVADNCYNSMFYYSRGLKTPPSILPATRLAVGCYMSMFSRCTALTSVPELPAMVLTSNCYRAMFESCNSLVTVPKNMLPAMELADSCYLGMFNSSLALTNAPNLPAEILKNSCYQNMFRWCGVKSPPEVFNVKKAAYNCCYYMFGNCGALTATPTLTALDLGQQSYYRMFSDCIKLTVANDLPAPFIADRCYYQMFYNCTALSTPPKISGVELSRLCCYEMFYNCKSLTSAPFLPAEVPTTGSYRGMFKGCSGITSISTNLIDWKENLSATTDWVSGVSTNGLFYKNDLLGETYDTSHIPSNWDVNIETLPKEPLLFTSKQNNNKLRLAQIGSPSAISLNCNKNNTGWTTYSVNDIIELDLNLTLAFSGLNNWFSKDASNYYRFLITGAFEASGNIQSLVNYKNIIETTYQYDNLFSGCSTLKTAPSLPANVLNDYCYQQMFMYCTSLTSLPDLTAPVMKNSCYKGMFNQCTGIKSIPPFSATILADRCFRLMFKGCTGITSIPLLSYITLYDYCYTGMFEACRGITGINYPLPAMVLSQQCYYNMFYNCSKLSSVPLNMLPATTLAANCYRSMFGNCTSLTSAPTLPATNLTNYCYGYMFYGCKELLNGPELNATNLYTYCYAHMFDGCSKLSSAFVLPACTLSSGCYNHMFNNCNKLNYIEVSFTSWNIASTFDNWVNNVAPTGTFKKPVNLDELFAVNRIPPGWDIIVK